MVIHLPLLSWRLHINRRSISEHRISRLLITTSWHPHRTCTRHSCTPLLFEMLLPLLMLLLHKLQLRLLRLRMPSSIELSPPFTWLQLRLLPLLLLLLLLLPLLLLLLLLLSTRLVLH
jgi:hypothetical protein